MVSCCDESTGSPPSPSSVSIAVVATRTGPSMPDCYARVALCSATAPGVACPCPTIVPGDVRPCPATVDLRPCLALPEPKLPAVGVARPPCQGPRAAAPAHGRHGPAPALEPELPAMGVTRTRLGCAGAERWANHKGGRERGRLPVGVK